MEEMKENSECKDEFNQIVEFGSELCKNGKSKTELCVGIRTDEQGYQWFGTNSCYT